jgi:hypothetical protein
MVTEKVKTTYIFLPSLLLWILYPEPGIPYNRDTGSGDGIRDLRWKKIVSRI